MRFKNHGLPPKSAADFTFLLHGFHFLKDEGVMAIILPHGVLFRGGAEERIRTKLLKDGHIDTVIGLPANLFYSTGETFVERYKREVIRKTDRRQALILVAKMAEKMTLSVGCSCEDERYCHRSILIKLIRRAGTKKFQDAKASEIEI